MSNSSTQAHSGTPVPRYLAPVRVFLVEDSPLLCEKIVEEISDEGRVEVVGQAGTEGAAMRRVGDARPDVVIIDIRLREGNGVNVLRFIAGMRWLERPVLIVLTSYAIAEYERECRALGADYFFDKATEFERVGEVLQSLADERRRVTQH